MHNSIKQHIDIDMWTVELSSDKQRIIFRSQSGIAYHLRACVFLDGLIESVSKGDCQVESVSTVTERLDRGILPVGSIDTRKYFRLCGSFKCSCCDSRQDLEDLLEFATEVGERCFSGLRCNSCQGKLADDPNFRYRGKSVNLEGEEMAD